jgi:hypothetical protein
MLLLQCQCEYCHQWWLSVGIVGLWRFTWRYCHTVVEFCFSSSVRKWGQNFAASSDLLSKHIGLIKIRFRPHYPGCKWWQVCFQEKGSLALKPHFHPFCLWIHILNTQHCFSCHSIFELGKSIRYRVVFPQKASSRFLYLFGLVWSRTWWIYMPFYFNHFLIKCKL